LQPPFFILVLENKAMQNKQPVQQDAAIRQKIMAYWDSLDDTARQDLKSVARNLSQALDMPVTVVEQHLAEWTAGKKA